MLKDSQYDKVKLLHQLSSLAWFINQHALENAKAASEHDYAKILEEIKRDIDKHLLSIKESLC